MTDTPSESQPKKNYYGDKIEEIKEIPILDICQLFHIPVYHRGHSHKCSIRSEDKTPSAVLHIESNGRFPKNTYHDFGTNESGDNIALACRLMGLDKTNPNHWYKAVDYLATAFHISPEEKKKEDTGHLSNREYMLLGLYGDRATKNFRFDPDHQTPEQMNKIEAEYNMSLNELKKKHPRTFERLLKTIAIPRLWEERNRYYIQIWEERQLQRSIMGEKADIRDTEQFTQAAKELQAMERALSRAVIGTTLSAPPNADYDPKSILERIDAGTLQPDFGPKTKTQMRRLAETNQTSIRYRQADFHTVYYRGEEYFQDIPYSAFLLNNGQAVIRYLAKDEDRIAPILQNINSSQPDKPKTEQTKRLQDKLDAAEMRCSSQSETTLTCNFHQAYR